MGATGTGKFRVGLARITHSLARGAGLATARFPVAAGLIAAIAILSNLAAASIYLPTEADFTRLIAALYGAAAGSVLARLAAEAHDAGSWARGLAPALAALLSGSLIWFGPRLDVFAPALIAALTLGIPLAPYVARQNGGRFWTFAFWSAVGVVLAFFSVFLFMAGVSAILEMIRLLFEVGLSTDAYEHMYTTAFTLVGPLFALGRIPRDFEEAASPFGDERLLGGVRILFDWVAAPLALITAVILHLYVAKIIITGELPKNEIGWIATFFSMLVLSLRVAVDPFIREGAAPTRLFARLWSVMLVVPLMLLAYAIWLRVGSEGLTLQRYYLTLGALAAGLVVMMQAFRRSRGDIRLVFAVPVLLLAFSAVGPWSAPQMVGRSQAGLIRAAFAERSEGADGLIRTAELTEGERDVLRSRLRALGAVEQLDRIEPMLEAGARENLSAAVSAQPAEAERIILSALGLDRAVGGRPLLVVNAEGEAVLDLFGYDVALIDRALPFGFRRGNAARADPEPIRLALEGEDLLVTIGMASDRFALGAAVRALPETAGVGGGVVNMAPPVLDLESAGGRRIRVRVRNIVIEEGPDAASSALVTVLLRRGDWPPFDEGSLGSGVQSGNSEPVGEVGERAR